jgi:hypothetical protein
MPGRDGTGPAGQGPMTGGGGGFCADDARDGRGRYRGWGAGRGRCGGRGRGGWRWQPGPISRERELDGIKQQAAALERTLDELQRRVSSMLQTPSPTEPKK